MPNRMARAILAAIFIFTSIVALANCDATAEGNAGSYKRACSRVSSLPEFNAWPGRVNAVFGAHADKKSVINKKGSILTGKGT